MVWDIQSYEDISTNHNLNDELFSDRGVCRTAPATPGLLIIHSYVDTNPLLYIDLLLWAEGGP